MGLGGFEVVFVLVLVLANGLFAMSEIAVISARKTRLQQMAEDGNLGAKVALDLSNSPNLFLSTVQVGITLVGVLSGAFSGVYFADRLATFLNKLDWLVSYSHGVSLTIIVFGMTYLSLVIGELVPKRLALNNPERVASLVASPMKVLSRLASPVISLLSASTELVLRVVGMRPENAPPVTEEEIKVMIDQATDAGVFDEAEQEMVERVFRLGDRKVGVLMTPRKMVEWLDIDDSADRNRRKIIKSSFSRLPVSQGRIGNLLGVVHVKDLLNRSLKGLPFDLRSCLSQPLFAFEGMQVLKILELFRETGNQMALIIDEYGTIEGIVTLNDVLEALIGDIPSSDEAEETKVMQREDGSWLVDGMLPIDEIKELFKIKSLPGDKTGQFHTLGGFVMTHMGRIPNPGDHFETCGLRIEVIDMDGHRVDKVLVDRIESTAEEESD